jgi:hypothetical protein
LEGGGVGALAIEFTHLLQALPFSSDIVLWLFFGGAARQSSRP